MRTAPALRHHGRVSALLLPLWSEHAPSYLSALIQGRYHGSTMLIPCIAIRLVASTVFPLVLIALVSRHLPASTAVNHALAVSALVSRLAWSSVA